MKSINFESQRLQNLGAVLCGVFLSKNLFEQFRYKKRNKTEFHDRVLSLFWD